MLDAPPPIFPDWILNLVAGLGGGAVRAVTQPDQSWLQRITTSFVGAVTAVYLTPIIAPVIQGYLSGYPIAYGSISGGCGFLCGISGISAAEFVIKLIRRKASGKD